MPDVVLLDVSTGQPTRIPAEKVRESLASGQFVESSQVAAKQGLNDGVALTPESQAVDRLDLGQGVSQSTVGAAGALAQENLEEEYGGFRGGVESFGEGILRGLTLGVYQGGQGLEHEARREVNSGLYTAGELAAFVASMGVPLSPAGGAVRLSAKAGQAITKAAGGGRLASVAGAAAEGAVFGAISDTVSQVSDAVIRDKPYVAERLVSAVEMGALFGGATEAVLQGAKRAIAHHKANEATASATKKALMPDEELGKLHQGIRDSRKVLDDSLDEFSQRQTVLSSFRDDVIEGRAIAASQDGPWFRAADDWFKTNDDLLAEAYKLRKKLDKFDESKLLRANKGSMEDYAETVAQYEDKLAALQKQLGTPPPGLLNPARREAAEVVESVVDPLRPPSRNIDAPLQLPPQRGDKTGTFGRALSDDLDATGVFSGRQVRKPDWAGPAAKQAERLEAKAFDDALKLADPPAPVGSSTANIRGGANATAPGKGAKAAAAKAPAPPLKSALDRNPVLQKYLDDWQVAGSTTDNIFPTVDISKPRLAKPVGDLRSKVQEGIGGLNLPQGAIDLRNIYKLRPGKTASDLADAVRDAWAIRAFSDDVARESVGKATVLRSRGHAPQEHPVAKGLGQRIMAPLARYAVRRQLGYGYSGMIGGQLAYGALAGIGGALGAVVGMADEVHMKAAHAVDRLLSGRTGKVAKVGSKLSLSYTGDPEEASPNTARRVHQLNMLRMNPQAIDVNVQKRLEFLVKHDPELAAHAMDSAKSKLLALSMRAPAFIAAPDKVPDRPLGAEWDAFEQYERVAHDAGEAISAISSGTLTAAMGEALREQHPQLHQRILEKVMSDLTPEKLEKFTPKQTEQLGYLLGQRLLPARFSAVQDSFMEQREVSSETPGGSVNWRGQPKTLSQQQQTPLVRPNQP